MIITAPYKIWGAYENFLGSFRRAVESAGKELKVPQRPLQKCFSRDQSGNVEFRQCFYLEGWPSKSLDRNKRLDIVIKALETFAMPNWLLTKSTVYINYLTVSNSAARLVQSLHYDFIAGGQIHHPLFHVQIGLEAIPEDDMKSTGFALELNSSSDPSECHVTTRIPTPEMTFTSVLYCLVADHLHTGIFRQFDEEVELMLTNSLPCPNFDSVKTSLRASCEHFKSRHWFAHDFSGNQ